MVRLSTTRLVIVCVTITAIVAMNTYFSCRGTSGGNTARNPKHVLTNDIPKPQLNESTDQLEWGEHKLAVIVPFRDRFEELMEFAPWIHKFLNKQEIRHRIIVVNQVDTHRFNRASLINIGFVKSNTECDYMVMHDVDLLPNNPDLKYTFPEKGVHHLASPEIHPIYHYAKYVGGVLMLKMSDFQLCRGMSNIFWGWGREDDEFFMRMKENGLSLLRPTGITTGYNTFKHIHDKVKRPRDYKRYGTQKQVQFKRDPATGFDTVQYKLVSQKELVFDGAPVTIFNVELFCDVAKVPWCDHEKPK